MTGSPQHAAPGEHAAPGAIGVFAKYWLADNVKTRLANSIGAQAARAVYSVMLDWTLQQLALTCLDRYLVFTPASARDDFQRLAGDRWNLVPQTGGDLGDRLTNFCGDMLQRGYPRIAVVGCDAPLLTANHLGDALHQLDQHDVVLGPARDGGYYLAAMRGDRRQMFQGISWSTPQTWAQTIAQIRRCGWTCGTLETLVDVDRVEDLRNVVEQLGERPDADAQSKRLRQLLVEALNDSVKFTWPKDRRPIRP